MRQIIAIFLIAGFLGVAVFGIWAMHPAPGHSSVCIASVAKGQPCVGEKDVFGSLNFHLNAFKSFSTGIFNGSIFAALLLSAVLTLALASIFGQTTDFAINYQATRPLEQYSPHFQRKFIHWLALHENSPNFSKGALT